MISLMRGTPSVTFMLATPAKWKVLSVIWVPGSPAGGGGGAGRRAGRCKGLRRREEAGVGAGPQPEADTPTREAGGRARPPHAPITGHWLARSAPAAAALPAAARPPPSPHPPMLCAPKAPTVDPGSMRFCSYRRVHCSTNARSSAAVTPAAGARGAGGEAGRAGGWGVGADGRNSRAARGGSQEAYSQGAACRAAALGRAPSHSRPPCHQPSPGWMSRSSSYSPRREGGRRSRARASLTASTCASRNCRTWPRYLSLLNSLPGRSSSAGWRGRGGRRRCLGLRGGLGLRGPAVPWQARG